jgi:hypothetical protein
MTGMDRLADGLFIGFAISPEWDTREPLDPKQINITPIFSQQILQYEAFRATFLKIQDIIQQELALPHIYSFNLRLNEATPGQEYTVNREMHENTISMTSGIPPPRLPTLSPPLLHSPHLLSTLPPHIALRSPHSQSTLERPCTRPNICKFWPPADFYFVHHNLFRNTLQPNPKARTLGSKPLQVPPWRVPRDILLSQSRVYASTTHLLCVDVLQ